MKINVCPVSDLTPQQTADWVSLLESSENCASAAPLPYFAAGQSAGREASGATHRSESVITPRDAVSINHPFLRPEFVQFVGRVLPDVHVAVLSENGSNVGFFPFERAADGQGLPVGRLLSEVHGAIVASGTTWNATELLRECDLAAWTFDHLIADQEPFRCHHAYVDESYVMDLRGGYEAYAQQRRAARSSAVKQGERKRRKLERELGPVRFTAHSSAPEDWRALAQWKGEQLTRMGYANMFHLDWVNALLEELRSTSMAGISPLLSTVHAGDELVAVHLGICTADVASSWIPTFAAEHNKYSPGLILQLELAKWAAEQGIERIDLGRGENQMKLSLASGWFNVAVGSVDSRVLHQAMTRAYYGLRNMVHASPLRDVSFRAVRRLRSWMS